MPLRILHAIRSVNPAGGGPIEGLKQISAINQNRGHEVEVISLDAPDEPWVRDCPLPCYALGPGLLNYGYAPLFSDWLRGNRRNYDAVVVNGIWQYNALGVWRALHGTPTPYFVFTHGMLDPWFKHTYPLKHVKKWLYWPWGDYRVLRDAAAVLFTCEEERRLARESFWLYKCHECVVNYGTASPTGDALAQREAFLEKFPGLRGKRCLLFLGRVHPKKGPDLLLRALARVLKEAPPESTRDLHLAMVGPHDHDYGAAMIRLTAELGLQDRVTWTGMLMGDLKWGAFHAADAFVLTSHQENFGISVAEALACGVPVLISNKVNIWREIKFHRAGLVETDDAEGSRLLLENWLRMPAEARDAMRGLARECYERRFNVEHTADGLISMMEAFGIRGGKRKARS